MCSHFPLLNIQPSSLIFKPTYTHDTRTNTRPLTQIYSLVSPASSYFYFLEREISQTILRVTGEERKNLDEEDEKEKERVW